MIHLDSRCEIDWLSSEIQMSSRCPNGECMIGWESLMIDATAVSGEEVGRESMMSSTI